MTTPIFQYIYVTVLIWPSFVRLSAKVLTLSRFIPVSDLLSGIWPVFSIDSHIDWATLININCRALYMEVVG